MSTRPDIANVRKTLRKSWGQEVNISTKQSLSLPPPPPSLQPRKNPGYAPEMSDQKLTSKIGRSFNSLFAPFGMFLLHT